jgi:phage-related protein
MGSSYEPPKQPHRPVLFCVVRERVVVLNGFIKKTQKTPDEELVLARKRRKEFEE